MCDTYLQNYKLDITFTTVNIPNFVYDKDTTTDNSNVDCFDTYLGVMQ